MLSISKLSASANECLGWPYESPGTNDSSGIDCSGLFVYAFRQLGASIYHGSNTIYRNYCGKKGRLTDALKKSLLPGTAVFTGKTDTDHGHIGLYVGNGKVVEASGTQAGVCTSNITANKWTYYGLLKEVVYPETGNTENTEPAKDESFPTLRKGDKGPWVTKAQTELAQRGYSLGSSGIDGDFGPATESAVKKFQRDWGLDQDGVIGPKTWSVLTSAPVKEKTYTVTVKGLTASQAKALLNNYKNATMKEE